MVARARLLTALPALLLLSPAELPIAPATRGEVLRPAKAPTSTAAMSARLGFIENRGQVDGPVTHYLSRGSSTTYFTPGGTTVALSDGKRRWAVKLGFIGARRAVPVADLREEAVVSYFRGAPEEWTTGVPTYARLRYRDLWPGIDLVYRHTGGGMKYEFVVAPGADPGDIRIAHAGAEATVRADGYLELSTPLGEVVDEAPVSFQGSGAERVEVESSYSVDAASIGFRLGRYDRTRPLVIDPAVLAYSGYIGGARGDGGHSVAVGPDGSAYVAGQTYGNETTFPVAVGPDLTFNGVEGVEPDAFVAKINSGGTEIVYAGYVGGTDYDGASGISVDGSGRAYVTGLTESSPAEGFPVAVGPDLTHGGGVVDADGFIVRVDPAGTALEYAGYIGGSDDDRANDVAVDPVGNAYVTGTTGSSGAEGFPVLKGPDGSLGGFRDAFVLKIDPTAQFEYSGYIGGSADEEGFGIAVDASGRAFATGVTESIDLPSQQFQGPDEIYNGGGLDAYIAAVLPDPTPPGTVGNGFTHLGYIGGAGRDYGTAVATDGSGGAYVAGFTNSTEATFPDGDGFGPLTGPDLTYNGGIADVFVVKAALPTGAPGTFAYAGYLGGAAGDGADAGAPTISDFPRSEGPDIAVSAAGIATVAGVTPSTDFPESGGPGPFQGGTDVFLTRLHPLGTSLVFSGFLGGPSLEAVGTVAVDGSGATYVSGVATEGFPTVVGPDLTYGGKGDAFIAKVTEGEQGSPGNDTIKGTPGDDVIDGGGGNDILIGLGGNDVLIGGEGKDVLIGGAGDDVLDGGPGMDAASYPGKKRVVANLLLGTAIGSSTDTLIRIEDLFGSAGKDVLKGDDGPNRLLGRGGDDRILGRKGKDRLNGGKGTDRLNGGGGKKDACDGGAGEDAAKRCERLKRLP